MSDDITKRRTEKGLLKGMKLAGDDVVVAATVSGPRDERGNRPYKVWVNAPQTEHSNAEIIQVLAMLAMTPVFGNAQASGRSVQECIDEATAIFGKSLEFHAHQMVASGQAMQNLKTVQIERPGSTN